MATNDSTTKAMTKMADFPEMMATPASAIYDAFKNVVASREQQFVTYFIDAAAPQPGADQAANQQTLDKKRTELDALHAQLKTLKERADKESASA